jgi:hypothetical protein
MGKFNADCCQEVATVAPNAESSGTLTGGSFTVPAGARSVTLIIHSSGGIKVDGEVNAVFSWAGSSRTWNATATRGTDAAYVDAFNFNAQTATVVWEVDYQI